MVSLIRLLGALAVASGFSRDAGASGWGEAHLAKAARETMLSTIDYNETQCGRDRTVETWLTALTKRDAASIRWTGGRCLLVRKEIARDSGGRWCGQAHIGLRRPLRRSDSPMVEIYFEPATDGRPKAYAFRGSLLLPDGDDYARFSSDFEAAWLARFSPGAPRCEPGTGGP